MLVEINHYKNLIESELFRIGPVVVFIWENKKNWPVASVSANIQRIYGHSSINFLNSKLQYAQLIHPDDIEKVFKEVRDASESTVSSFTHEPYRLQCDNKKFKWVQDTTIIIREEGVITHYVGYIVDITELKELQEKNDNQTNKLLKNEAFLNSYKIAMDESSVVSKADLEGNITYVNNNFCKISGYTREEVLGQPHKILRYKDSPKEVFKELWETIQSKKVWKGILHNQGKKTDYWVDISILPILNENQEIVEYIAVRHDVTNMKKQKQKLDNIANTDTLTGLGNRYKLNNDIKKSVLPALAIINVDNFSQINDFYGHEKGDIIIKKLGNRILKAITNKNYKLYHLQGDEYVIFNENITRDTFIENIKNINLNVSSIPLLLEEEEILLNLSIAISFEEKSSILTSADMALKIARKNNVDFLIYHESISLNTEYENNIKWTKKIKKAIEADNIIPVFQPIVNNQNNKWEKFESLVRLQDSGKLISPYFFLEISKKTKHYKQITKIMIEKSFEVFKDKDVEFSINITIEDIMDEDIINFIYTTLDKYKLGSKVVFEIVESESIQNFEQVSKFIQSIKNQGCKVAIDDFGTGYSNFEYLMKLKVDYIKIDGSMIKNIDTNEDAQVVVETIVNFAKKMNIKTIAEFVENESVLNKVKELGIDYSQGYYFSEPKVWLDLPIKKDKESIH